MSCTYYIRKNICEHCGRYDKIQIGISSIEWPFCCEGAKDFAGWKELIGDNPIYNEYEELQPIEQFFNFVESKQKHMLDEHWKEHIEKYNGVYERVSSDGYRFVKGEVDA